MFNNLSSLSRNKSSVFLLVLALIVGGVGAQATGLLNTESGGYLVCVNSKTNVVTHPGTSSCPKGSKRLVLGAQGAAGANGLTGAAGLSGRDGSDGKDGKTLWNGVKDPESTWGAPGDMFINTLTKTLFGPKSLDGTWPAGVSMIGPKGDQGLTGLAGLTGAQGLIGLTGLAGLTGAQGLIGLTGLTGATGPQGPGGANGGSGPAGAAGATGAQGPIGLTGVAAPVVTGANCIGTKCTYKVGDTGPGGGLIFFVDYFDQYTGFNYLEAAPKECEAEKIWSSDTTNSLETVNGWAARAVGSGQANTTAMLTNGALFIYVRDTSGAAFYANTLANGVPVGCVTSKDDWFLGSIGEMNLMYDNLQGLGGFVDYGYWSSSELSAGLAWFQDFYSGTQFNYGKGLTGITLYVRPVRAF